MKKVEVFCDQLGQIELPLSNSRIVDFVDFGAGPNNRRSAIFVPCPCCQINHLTPISEKLRRELVMRSIPVVRFDPELAQGNVPPARSNQRKFLHPFSNGLSEIQADLRKIEQDPESKVDAAMESALKSFTKVYGSASRSQVEISHRARRSNMPQSLSPFSVNPHGTGRDL